MSTSPGYALAECIDYIAIYMRVQSLRSRYMQLSALTGQSLESHHHILDTSVMCVRTVSRTNGVLLSLSQSSAYHAMLGIERNLLLIAGWLQHLVGTAPESTSAWDNLRCEPTTPCKTQHSQNYSCFTTAVSDQTTHHRPWQPTPTPAHP
jgi:hypothetical protein